jgi:hypothetical protein
MALKDTRGGREYDKFLADSSGDTALRTTSTSSVTEITLSASADVTPATGGTSYSTNTILIGKGSGGGSGANVDVSGKSRIGIQIFNIGDAVGTFKVWGNLVTDGAGLITGGDYTQIGDDISVTNGSSAYRAISTTPIKNIGVSGTTSGTCTANVYVMAD